MASVLDPSGTQGQPWERAAFFLLPGILQGVGIGIVGDSEITRSNLWLLMLLIFAPCTYFLTTAAGRRIGPAVFAIGLGAALAAMAHLAQGWQPELNIYASADDPLNTYAAQLSFSAAMVIAYIAIPFFRTVTERRQPPNHYPSLFEFAWTLPVIGLTASAFAGAVWLIWILIAALFDMIGIATLRDLTDHGPFSMALTFGAGALGVGVTRERENLILALRSVLLMLVRSVAPIFAVATGLFLIFFTARGFSGLDAGVDPFTLLIAGLIAAAIFVNAVIADAGKPTGRALGLSARAISVVMVVLSVMALIQLRRVTTDDGVTPGLIGAWISLGLLTLYALAYAVPAIWQGRWGIARQANIALAGLLILIMLWVQTPLYRVAEWSASSQEVRLRKAEEITKDDIQLLAFGLGEPGRAAMARLLADGVGDAFAQTLMAEAAGMDDVGDFWRVSDRPLADQADAYATLVSAGTIVELGDLSAMPLTAKTYFVRHSENFERVKETPVFIAALPGDSMAYVLIWFSTPIYVAGSTEPTVNEVTEVIVPDADGGWTSFWRANAPAPPSDGDRATRIDAIRTKGVQIAPMMIPVVVVGGTPLSPYSATGEVPPSAVLRLEPKVEE